MENSLNKIADTSFKCEWNIVQQNSGVITTTIDPLSAGLITISFDQ